MILCLSLCACAGTASESNDSAAAPKNENDSVSTSISEKQTETEVIEEPLPEEEAGAASTEDASGGGEEESASTIEASGGGEEESSMASLLYMGQGSLRIVTGEEKVIYIDPYSGDGYDLPADLILVTHDHYDHNQVELVGNRNEDCRTITQQDALADGAHQTFELGYVTVEAVEAGYNDYHDANECVGYVLTFSDGISVYVTGDTSTTQQMPLLAEKNIDYAFFCCDGIYNMDAAEASKCAEMVGAKHNLPYHTSAQNDGYNFDRDVAESFDADNRIILAPGDEINLD